MDAWAIDNIEIDKEITLRQFTPDDVDIVYQLVHRNADHLLEYMQWMVPEYDHVMAREFIDSSIMARQTRESLGYGIFRGGSLLGAIGFASFDWTAKATEIGYWIDKREEGKGIVSRAARVLIDYAFNNLEINRIEIRCAAGNTRSAAIPERFGFKLEGCLRQSRFRNGKLHDFLIFGLLRSEWKGEDHA